MPTLACGVVWSANGLARQIRRMTAALRHAFALSSEGEQLSVEDQALLERVAHTVLSRQMGVPAVLFLESVGPMNFLGSQAVHFLLPMLELACDAHEIARLLERRDVISRLIELIEAGTASGRTTVR
jgi:hypothetical protein